MIVALAPNARAQAVAVAEVDGYVTDPSGQTIVGAQVKMIEVDKQQVHVTSTDATGRYALPNLPVGDYKLEVSVSGFKTYVQTGITLQVATNIVVNVAMQIGSVTESIEVAAAAAMVETKENAIGQVIDEHRMVDLPLNGRDPSQLLTLTGAGTNNMALNGNDLTGNKNMGGSNASRAFSVAGSQANGLSYLLDGGDNNDAFSNVNLPLPMPDAIQEFNVQTNALPAQYGLHPGGIVNIVTKSGANSFHGDLFEFLRNGDLNARQKATPLRDSLKRSQFGGTAGGRIVKDKLFFFGGYQGTRQRSDPTNNNAYVPTAAALNGDFSVLEAAKSAGGCLASARTLKNPYANNAPFPNNQVPVSLFDPAALKLVNNYIPTSKDPCGLIQYAIPANNPDDQWIGRVDYVISDKQSLYVRYFIYDFLQAAVFDGKNALPTSTPGLQQRSQTATIGHAFAISSSMVNSFHATFDRRRDDRGSASNLFSPKDLGVNMFQALPNYIQVTVSSYFNVACGTCAPGYFNVNTYQLSDDLSVIRGKHQLAFGVDYRRDQLNVANFQQANGQFTFSGNSSGDGLADLMIGRIGTLTNGNPNPDALRETVFALYAQDAFHATSHLSINYGIRWEPSLPSYDSFGRGNRFDMSLLQQGVHSTQYPAAPAGLVFANDANNSYGKALTAAHWATFSPRLGLVWDVNGDGKQTIRAAFGLMHDTTELYYPERWTTNPPYASSISLTNVQLSNPYASYVSPTGQAGDPFPGAAIFPSFGTYISIPANVKPTYMMQWNISYQRQIGKDWLVTANYLGNRTRHLWGSVDINPALVVAGATTSNDNQRRVLYLANSTQGQYYGQIVQTDDGGRAAYNGLLLSLQHRFASNFTLLSNYTWAHCISDVEFLGELGNTVYQNSSDREHGERGNCTSDHRQIFNTSLSVTSPGMGGGFTRKLTGGWQLSPIVSLFTGQMLTPTDGSKDISLTGDLKDRPNVILGGSIYQNTTSAWFNPLAFGTQATGTFGNAGRYSIVGPGVISWDMAISRQFQFKERWTLHLRADFFNIMNHANWSNPTVDSTSGTFGQITTFSSPRIIQVATKLYF
jgi:hypothetical protein